MLGFIKNLLNFYLANPKVNPTSQTLEVEVATAPPNGCREKLIAEKRRNGRLKILLSYYKEEAKSIKGKPRVKQKLFKDPEAKEKLQKWAGRVKVVGCCDTCLSKNDLTAHHLYDKFTHPSVAFIDDNGVCLCTSCHHEFHSMYTCKTNCTPSMYLKFKIKKRNSLKI